MTLATPIASNPRKFRNCVGIRSVVWFAALILPWSLWFWSMRVRWSAGPESYFGWAVLPFAAYLFQLRWESRPKSALETAKTNKVLGGILTLVGCVVLDLATIILRPNPLWTAAGWLACCACVLTSIGLLLERGGWAWVRHFLWIALFPFLALPWPSPVHVYAMGPFRHGISSLVAELISLAFAPAVANGAMIELPSGTLGIDAACSGIRSLQTALMCAFFLGELLCFRLKDRILLLCGSGLIVIAANFLRVLLLASIAACRDLKVTDSWHDPLGVAEMLLVLILVPALALTLNGRRKVPADACEVTERRGCDAPSPVIAAATVGMLFAGVLSCIFWYRPNSALEPTPLATWSLQPLSSDWVELPLEKGALQILGCRKSRMLVSDQRALHKWIAAYMQWDGDPAYVYAAGAHSPEICLSNTGAVFEAFLAPLKVDLGGRLLEFERMRFSAHGETLHVFVLRWDSEAARSVSGKELMDLEFGALRRSLVLERKSAPSIEKILIAISGYRDDEEARLHLEQVLPQLLRAEWEK